MRTAEHAAAGAGAASGPGTSAGVTAAAGSAWRTRLVVWGALAVVLAGGLALRLWGYRQGLPFVYNIDEADHFVPHAVAMFQHGTLNPHYFANPPAFTYVLHFLFALVYGGGSGVVAHYRAAPRGRLRARACRGGGARDALAVAAVSDRRAPARPRRRPAGGGDRGGRLPAELLLAPGAQRRADAGAAERLAAGHRGGAAQRASARLPARGRRARARVRDQVHRRDRARAAACGAPRAASRQSGDRGGADGACSPAC